MTPDKVRDREEIAEQIKALQALKEMALKYGFDISRPAANARYAAISASSSGFAAPPLGFRVKNWNVFAPMETAS